MNIQNFFIVLLLSLLVGCPKSAFPVNKHSFLWIDTEDVNDTD